MADTHKTDAEAWLTGAESPQVPPGEAAIALASIAQAHATLALVEATERLAKAQEVGQGFTDVDLGRMAQRFYEVASRGEDALSFPSMTGKGKVIEAIHAALEYVGKL